MNETVVVWEYRYELPDGTALVSYVMPLHLGVPKLPSEVPDDQPWVLRGRPTGNEDWHDLVTWDGHTATTLKWPIGPGAP